MKSPVLLLITSDPRTSAKPAEAVRIAAGVSTWGKVAVTLYLREAAVLLLSEFPDELVDEENFARYLPMIERSGGLILAQRGSSWLREIGEAPVSFREVSDTELAELASGHGCVTRF